MTIVCWACTWRWRGGQGGWAGWPGQAVYTEVAPLQVRPGTAADSDYAHSPSAHLRVRHSRRALRGARKESAAVGCSTPRRVECWSTTSLLTCPTFDHRTPRGQHATRHCSPKRRIELHHAVFLWRRQLGRMSGVGALWRPVLCGYGRPHRPTRAHVALQKRAPRSKRALRTQRSSELRGTDGGGVDAEGWWRVQRCARDGSCAFACCYGTSIRVACISRSPRALRPHSEGVGRILDNRSSDGGGGGRGGGGGGGGD